MMPSAQGSRPLAGQALLREEATAPRRREVANAPARPGLASTCFRKAALYVKGVGSFLSINSGVVGIAAAISSVYQQYAFSGAIPPSGIDNPTAQADFEDCVVNTLMPANITIPAAALPAHGAYVPIATHSSSPEAGVSISSISYCISRVGDYLLYNQIVAQEHKLAEWRYTHPRDLAIATLLFSFTAGAIAVMVPRFLNHCADALAARAQQQLQRSVTQSTAVVTEIELTAHQAVIDMPAEQAPSVPNHRLARSLHSRLAEKIEARESFILNSLFTPGTLGLIAAAGIWWLGSTHGKMNHQSPNYNLTFNDKSFRGLTTQVAEYTADRRESMQFREAWQISAWTGAVSYTATVMAGVCMHKARSWLRQQPARVRESSNAPTGEMTLLLTEPPFVNLHTALSLLS